MSSDQILLQNKHEVVCPLCGGNKSTLRFPATKEASRQTTQHFSCTNSYLAQHGDIVECQQCGMVYNNPQPKPEELLDIYRQIVDPRYIKEERGREQTFNISLSQLHQYCEPPGKLLDIGCYTGTFMKIAAMKGWEVSGVELSSWAAQIARGLEIGSVYEGHAKQIPSPPNSFDVITLWDVIEHLHNPLEVLNTTSRLLKPEGLLALSTHLIDSYPVRILGTHYPFFMEMHLIHFSRKTLHTMLAACGYEVLSIVPHYRVITLTYFLGKLQALLPLGRFLIQPILKRQAALLDTKFIKIGISGLSNIFAKNIKR